jgi:hypothetical protein
MNPLSRNVIGSLGLSVLASVLIIAIVALVAGCTGSDSNSSSTPHTTGSGSPTPPIGGQGSTSATTSSTATATSKPSGSPISSVVAPTGTVVSNCPPLDTVNSTLGLTNNTGPEISPYHQGIQCVYSATGNIPPPIPQVWVYFEPAVAASFIQGENGLINSGLATAVMGLGDQAYVFPGDINVLKGSTKIEIVSPLSIPNPNGEDGLKALAQSIVASIN